MITLTRPEPRVLGLTRAAFESRYDGCSVDVEGVRNLPDGPSLVDEPPRQFCLLRV